MRIEASNQIARLYKSGKQVKVQRLNDVSAACDEVQISSTGRDYQIAKQAVADASDIREDKTAQLKERVSSGNYNVEVDDFANKLLEKYNALI